MNNRDSIFSSQVEVHLLTTLLSLFQDYSQSEKSLTEEVEVHLFLFFLWRSFLLLGSGIAASSSTACSSSSGSTTATTTSTGSFELGKTLSHEFLKVLASHLGDDQSDVFLVKGDSSGLEDLLKVRCSDFSSLLLVHSSQQVGCCVLHTCVVTHLVD